MKTILKLMCLAILMIGTCQGINAQTRRTPVRKTNTAQKRITPKSQNETTPSTKPEKVVAVDLGLSVKWANVDIDGNSETSGPLLAPYEDGKDVATQKLGDGWRLPTAEEFTELFNICNVDIILSNNIPTKIVLTSPKNGASITICIPKEFLCANDKYLTNPTGDNIYNRFLILSPGSVVFTINKTTPEALSEINYYCNSIGIQPRVETWSNETRNKILSALNKIVPEIPNTPTVFIFGLSNKLEYVGMYMVRSEHVDSPQVRIPIRAVFDTSSDDN